jgi:hypothetical protein
LVIKTNLYYDARSEKHQITPGMFTTLLARKGVLKVFFVKVINKILQKYLRYMHDVPRVVKYKEIFRNS